MITHRKTTKLSLPIALSPCDTLNVEYTDPVGNKFKLDTIKTERFMYVDTIKFFDVKDEFGFKDGLCAIVGESDKENRDA